MTDLEKILAASAASFASGLLLGVLLEKHREQKRTYQSVLDEYLKAVAASGVNDDEYLRFAALQRAGAWRLSLSELKRLNDDVQGRGLLSPYTAWSEVFPDMSDFPKGFLMWAKEKNVDLSKSDEALRVMAEEWDARNIPKPPGPGVAFL